MRTTAQILRDYRGPALFSFGFRPFFLLAAIWAALAVPPWLASYMGHGGAVVAEVFTRDWHVHEMLFGYAGAVVVGYMIVAGANWTGHFPVAGRPVVALAVLWLAGRAAMLTQPVLGPISALIEAAFLTLFAAALWREQLAAANWRSVPPCIVVTLLALANIAFHLHIEPAERASIALIAFLIAMMGGRLVPSFTRNWFAQRKIVPEPAPQGLPDRIALTLTGAGLALWVPWPEAQVTGALLVVGGAGLIWRLARWRGWVAAREGMVAILHLGYLWCGAGLVLLGLTVLRPGIVPPTAAIQALTAGAIGTMTLAMMTRTSRSHTGRAREADTATLAIYVLITVAALVRVLAGFTPLVGLLVLSSLCWSLGFGLFVLTYGPILTRPMQKARRADRA